MFAQPLASSLKILLLLSLDSFLIIYIYTDIIEWWQTVT